MSSQKILVADDEARMRELIKLYLQKENFIVAEASNGREVLEQLSLGDYALLILDIMMPEMDGWSVCREIRKKSDIPIIMLTARGEEIDKVLGLELGADDYVVKPFSPRELVARVKALLRRSNSRLQTGDVLNYPDLTIDHNGRKVVACGSEVNLTPKEFDLLYLLASKHGKVFSREQLLDQVWGYEFYGDARTVDTHIKNLREKLRAAKTAKETDPARTKPNEVNIGPSRTGDPSKYIVTVWGVGYKFEVV